MAELPELGFYSLAGGAKDPRALVRECADAEKLGLGSTFLSERFNYKEAATASGAIGAVTAELGIATAATNINTRHPIVTAAHATTMHKLTQGRYTMGFGRGIVPQMRALGLPCATTQDLRDFAQLMRRLFRGERVTDCSTTFGTYPSLQLDPSFDEAIPLALMAFGPKSLELAGQVFDAVILHTFFSEDTLARISREVRTAAEKVGRDPNSVRIWSVLATVGDHLPYEARLMKTVGRLATYLQLYGDLLVDTNRWDRHALEKFRADEIVSSFGGWIDQNATVAQLEHIEKLLPSEWLAAAADGTAKQCAEQVAAQFDSGADSVILHGASPDELAPVIAAYREQREPSKFSELPRNPGNH